MNLQIWLANENIFVKQVPVQLTCDHQALSESLSLALVNNINETGYQPYGLMP